MAVKAPAAARPRPRPRAPARAKYAEAIAAAGALGEIGIRTLLEGTVGSGQNITQEIERMTETP